MDKIKAYLLSIRSNLTKSFLTGMFLVAGMIGGFIMVKAATPATVINPGDTLTAAMWNNAAHRTLAIGDGAGNIDIMLSDVWSTIKGDGRMHIQAGPNSNATDSWADGGAGKLFLNPWVGAGDVMVGGGDASSHSLIVNKGDMKINSGQLCLNGQCVTSLNGGGAVVSGATQMYKKVYKDSNDQPAGDPGRVYIAQWNALVDSAIAANPFLSSPDVGTDPTTSWEYRCRVRDGQEGPTADNIENCGRWLCNGQGHGAAVTQTTNCGAGNNNCGKHAWHLICMY